MKRMFSSTRLLSKLLLLIATICIFLGMSSAAIIAYAAPHADGELEVDQNSEVSEQVKETADSAIEAGTKTSTDNEVYSVRISKKAIGYQAPSTDSLQVKELNVDDVFDNAIKWDSEGMWFNLKLDDNTNVFVLADKVQIIPEEHTEEAEPPSLDEPDNPKEPEQEAAELRAPLEIAPLRSLPINDAEDASFHRFLALKNVPKYSKPSTSSKIRGYFPKGFIGETVHWD